MANYKPNKAISTRYHGFNFRMLIAYDLRPPAGDPNIRAGHIRGFIRQQPDNRLGNFHRLTQSAHGYFPQHIGIGRRDHIGLGHAGLIDFQTLPQASHPIPPAQPDLTATATNGPL